MIRTKARGREKGNVNLHLVGEETAGIFFGMEYSLSGSFPIGTSLERMNGRNEIWVLVLNDC